MSGIVEEFQRELDTWARRHAGRPREEMLQLLLLSLEREGLVTVAYREELMLQRLGRMPLPEDVRELIHHALVWAWKDEEMHTVYLRGALLKADKLSLRALAYSRQAAGYVGGWASSVRQHVRWSDAPLSRFLATGILQVGRLTGQVPKEVTEYLRYRPFRDFCRFNVEAERTAALCYGRILQIGEEHPEVLPLRAEEVRRIQEDEDRHEQIFALIAAALDEGDRLQPDVTAEKLAGDIADVGEYFLPRRFRKQMARDNPLGSGGAVHVIQGTAEDEGRSALRRLLGDVDLAALLEERARVLEKPVSELQVAIKPTFMLGYHRRTLRRSPIPTSSRSSPSA